MKLAALLTIVLTSSLAAAELERVMLPVAPSVVFCGYHSRYDTRLLVYNGDARAATRLCTDVVCADLAPQAASEFIGDYAGGLPLPLFVVLPEGTANTLHMSLMVESSEHSRPEQRSFTELPIVKTSDFRTGNIQFVGVRMDPGFRQTIRMYGLNGRGLGQVMMRVYSLESGEMLHSCLHDLWPLTDAVNDASTPIRPSFGMECDMSEHVEANGQKVRIELEPVSAGLKYWAFLSITNNDTQHFYTVLPWSDPASR